MNKLKCNHIDSITQKPCNAYRILKDDKCFFHSKDPKIIKKRAAAVKKGAEISKEAKILFQNDIELNCLEDLAVFSKDLINWTLQKRIDGKRATQVSKMLKDLSAILEILEQAEDIKNIQKMAKRDLDLSSYD